MSKLEIALLGTPDIRLDNQPIKTDRRKAIALLAYLAVTHKPHARDRLAGLLWPDYEQDSAYAYLRRTLWELNQALGKGWIEADRDQIALNTNSDVWIDTLTFEDLVQNGADMEAAVNLYRGEFLAGFKVADTEPFETWQSLQTGYFRREYAAALEKLVDEKLKAQQYKAGLAHAQRWLELDNLNEAAHRAIMQLFAAMGDRSGAIRQYEICRDVLKDTLNIDPQPETTALYQAILTGEFSPEPGSSEPSSVSAPEVKEPASRLPVIPTPFIGRRKEVEQVKTLIRNSAYRLITLLGPGGTGKTRLSIQAASELVEDYPDGTFFVPLAPVHENDAMVQTIAKTVGLTLYSGEEKPGNQLLEFLRHKDLLLILDNLEQISTAPQLVTSILTNAPNTKLVVTSRVRLNVQGEQLYTVSGMSVPSSAEVTSWENPTDQAQPFSAVQLFIDRARRVQSDFELSSENIQSVIEICHLVEGMPLGIELAAAWLELLPPDEIAKEIKRSLDFLETSQADIPKRQRSIKAIFESSWKLLSAGEQETFLRLSVLVGTFSREAAQAVSGASLRTLLGLANKSWLQQTTDGRFQLHELMRQYGEERLRADERAWREAKNRHADYFADFVDRQSEVLRSPDQLTGLIAMTDELDGNIKSAWNWLVAEQRWDDLLDKMILGLSHYSFIRWKTVVLISWYRKARQAIESASVSDNLLAYLIFSVLEIHEEESNDIKDANPIGRLEKIWQLADQNNLLEALGFWYILLVMLVKVRNVAPIDNAQVEAVLNQVKEKYSRWHLGFSLFILSDYWWSFGLNYEKLLEAHQIFKEIGVPFGQAFTAEQLGKVTFQLRRPQQEVMGYYDEAKRLYQQLSGYTFHFNNLSHQVDIYLYLGELDKRFNLFDEEQRELERTGQFRLVEDLKNWEALFAVRYSSYEHALEVRQESIDLAIKYGSQSEIVWRQFEMGDVHRIFGHPEKALPLYDLTLPSFEKMNILLGLGFNQRGRGDIALQEGDFSKALAYYQKYLDYAEEDNHMWGIIQARSRVAMALAYLGRVEKAHSDLKSILSEVNSWRQGDLTLETLLAEPVCLLQQGKVEKAIETAAFIHHHRLSWNDTKQHAGEIIERASEGLTESQIAAAVERGKKYSLDEVVVQLTDQSE